MDWFTGFCTIFTAKGVRQTGVQEEASPSKKARRGRGRPKGSRKVFQVSFHATEGQISAPGLSLSFLSFHLGYW